MLDLVERIAFVFGKAIEETPLIFSFQCHVIDGRLGAIRSVLWGKRSSRFERRYRRYHKGKQTKSFQGRNKSQRDRLDVIDNDCWQKNFDVIVVSLEHRDGYSVTVGRPYKLGLFKKVSFGELFVMEGKHDIFWFLSVTVDLSCCVI